MTTSRHYTFNQDEIPIPQWGKPVPPDTQRELGGDFSSCQTLGWAILSRTRHRAIKTAMINVSTIDIKHWPWPRVEIAEGHRHRHPGQLEKLEIARSPSRSRPTGGCNYWWIIYCQHCPLWQWDMATGRDGCLSGGRLQPMTSTRRAVGVWIGVCCPPARVIESCSFRHLSHPWLCDLWPAIIWSVCVPIISIQYIPDIQRCIDALIARNHLSYK